MPAWGQVPGTLEVVFAPLSAQAARRVGARLPWTLDAGFHTLLFDHCDFFGDTLLHFGHLDFILDAPFWLKPASTWKTIANAIVHRRSILSSSSRLEDVLEASWSRLGAS